ncbi:MAG: tRNA preQ1(34) S-adenosylmethionine ribosyltransferase-isomerase QueA [Aestuariivita sp.]|nr:tRNA preQ1(34) S-adenosylmethionine ribosyltransferase-isomerase QueA [Aestuariivita sp.]
MHLADFDFELPEELIALRPVKPRTSARLLVAEHACIEDAHIFDLPRLLQPGDRLILNNTRVMQARLAGVRGRDGPEGMVRGRIEATLLEPVADGAWKALVKPLRKLRQGETIVFSPELSASVTKIENGYVVLGFNVRGADFDALLAQVGVMPLPPYIASRRQADEQDETDYQTVFAHIAGAVAAPTGSLHFDRSLLKRLQSKDIEYTFVTLHVGAGTFLPVRVPDIRKHRMHAERGHLSENAVREIIQTKKAGGRIIPVGTTALRLIETGARDGELRTWDGRTDLFIYPGFEFRVADALITNFHLPKSTLMMLVSAFMGRERMLSIYKHAIRSKYRFFSYGDSSLLVPF